MQTIQTLGVTFSEENILSDLKRRGIPEPQGFAYITFV
jgi:hypothetical protein